MTIRATAGQKANALASSSLEPEDLVLDVPDLNSLFVLHLALDGGLASVCARCAAWVRMVPMDGDWRADIRDFTHAQGCATARKVAPILELAGEPGVLLRYSPEAFGEEG